MGISTLLLLCACGNRAEEKENEAAGGADSLINRTVAFEEWNGLAVFSESLDELAGFLAEVDVHEEEVPGSAWNTEAMRENAMQEDGNLPDADKESNGTVPETDNPCGKIEETENDAPQAGAVVTGTEVNVPGTDAGTTETNANMTGTDNGTPENDAVPDSNADAEKVKNLPQEILNCLNAERAEAGLADFTWSEDLTAGAAVRSAEAAGSFSHIRPDGTKFYTVCSVAMAENLARGSMQTAASEIVSLWMSSGSGHRANIVDGALTMVGISIYENEGNITICALFG